MEWRAAPTTAVPLGQQLVAGALAAMLEHVLCAAAVTSTSMDMSQIRTGNSYSTAYTS
jgi:hypothetical protein